MAITMIDQIERAGAVWKGGIKDDSGLVSAESGVFADAPYSFDNRFEHRSGASPEELLAAAWCRHVTQTVSITAGRAIR